ncbi:MAG: hypothetical protein NTZ25_02895 [Candidatus Peregrinibacteria bacterium]|nr:hypothetical protein [Candidatus Peregrinibacteria bacterium]
MSKGKLITIYGINNVGKSTQTKILVEKLEKAGQKVKYLKYPLYDLAPTGPFLNSVLRSEGGQKISEDELQLWFILNRYQFQPELKKFLEEGYIVVAEDYVGTGIAWGTAKGLSQEWLEEANKFLLKEDLAIFIDGERDPRVIEKIHVHEQNPELMMKCAGVLKAMAKKFDWNLVERKSTIEETAGEIWEVVEGFLQK